MTVERDRPRQCPRPSTEIPVRTNWRRSTEDAISLDLHSSLEYLDNKDTFVRLLLIDYSSVSNTIVPSRLNSKLRDLGLSSALCNWILSFLTHRPQSVRIDNCTSSTITLNTGHPQGYILSPLLYSLKKGGEHAPIHINGTEVERGESIKFLGVAITDDLPWTSHIDATAKMAQQRLFFLRWLRKFGMSIRTLTNFY
eukprot:g28433.t1